MRIALDFVTIFYLLCTLSRCSSTPACVKSFQKPVVGACTTVFVGTVVESAFYLDTGTGPNHQENRCRCNLIIHTFNGSGINFIFQTEENIKQLNHSIEVGGHVLNSTVTKLDIRIQVETDILIKTDGIGGVCVSVAANKSEGTFGVNCNFIQITTPTTAIGSSSPTSHISQITTSGTSELNFNATPYSQTYSSGDDKERLIGPVVGGFACFVVLVAVTAIVMFCLRRRQRKLPKEKGIHSDKAINDQAHGDYIDITGNSLTVSSVADDRAISFIDGTYDDVKLDRNAGNQKDTKKAAIKQKQTENKYHYTSDKDKKTESPMSNGEAIESREDCAVYTAINKPQKTQAHSNQNEENSAIYSAVNKPPKIQAYTSQENVYDRTDSSDETVRKMEDYNRLGAVIAIGNATEDTYESAATIGRNEHFNQYDYDTSHGKL